MILSFSFLIYIILFYLLFRQRAPAAVTSLTTLPSIGQAASLYNRISIRAYSFLSSNISLFSLLALYTKSKPDCCHLWCFCLHGQKLQLFVCLYRNFHLHLSPISRIIIQNIAKGAIGMQLVTVTEGPAFFTAALSISFFSRYRYRYFFCAKMRTALRLRGE